MSFLVEQIEYYPTQETFSNDANSWLIKDAATAGTIYYGYSKNLGSDPAAAVWKIRREVLAANVTTITYADGNCQFDNVWTNRAALTYR